MKKNIETFKIYGFFAFECFRVRNSYFLFIYVVVFAFLLGSTMKMNEQRPEHVDGDRFMSYAKYA